MIPSLEIFTEKRLDIFSQLFVNLAAGWFGLVLITPQITGLDSYLLIKSILNGIVSLILAVMLKELNEY